MEGNLVVVRISQEKVKGERLKCDVNTLQQCHALSREKENPIASMKSREKRNV